MKKYKLLYIFFSLLVLHSCNAPSLQDPNLVGGAIVYSIVLVIGIYAIIMFKVFLYFIFYSFRAYYSPVDYKKKAKYLEKKFDHFIIGKSLSDSNLQSIKFKFFENFQYPEFLLKNQKNKTILSIDKQIPIAKFWARWIERRISNIWVIESKRKDNYKDKNLIWVVVINILYTKSNNLKEDRQFTLLEISDKDLTKEIYTTRSKKETKYSNDLNVTDKQEKFLLEVRAKNEKDSLKVVQKKELEENKSADIEDNHQSFMPRGTILEKETTDEVIKEEIEVDELMDEEKKFNIKKNKPNKADKELVLSKEEALNKLKEHKTLLDLEIITQDEYDKVKDTLKSTITKNE